MKLLPNQAILLLNPAGEVRNVYLNGDIDVAHVLALAYHNDKLKNDPEYFQCGAKLPLDLDNARAAGYKLVSGSINVGNLTLDKVAEDGTIDADPEIGFPLTAIDYEENLTGHRALVRELDVLLNGEEGAAKQASLCDIVAQVAKARGRFNSVREVLEKVL